MGGVGVLALALSTWFSTLGEDYTVISKFIQVFQFIIITLAAFPSQGLCYELILCKLFAAHERCDLSYET